MTKKSKEQKIKVKRTLPEGSTKGGEEAIYGIKANGKIMTGKPSKKTPEVLTKLQYALMRGCTEGEACAYAEISQKCLIDWKHESKEFGEQIEHRKHMYVQVIKFASFDRAIDTKNKDSTEILFKIDKRYSDKQDVKVEGQISLVQLAKQMQQKRLDEENGEQLADKGV